MVQRKKITKKKGLHQLDFSILVDSILSIYNKKSSEIIRYKKGRQTGWKLYKSRNGIRA